MACQTAERPDGSAYPARNMLKKQMAALACKDWDDFRTLIRLCMLEGVDSQTFENCSHGMALERLMEAIRHFDG